MTDLLPIWTDDAPLDARREGAYQRLMTMCPAPFRMIAQPMVKVAIERATEAEIDALLVDIDSLPNLAATGDMGAIVGLAKRYGATDDMIAQYLPLFESLPSARPDDT